MKDYSDKVLNCFLKCFDKKNDRARVNMEYAKRFFGKIYTLEEVIAESKKLLDEGADKVMIRSFELVKDKPFTDSYCIGKDLKINCNYITNEDPDLNNVVGFMIVGAKKILAQIYFILIRILEIMQWANLQSWYWVN